MVHLVVSKSGPLKTIRAVSPPAIRVNIAASMDMADDDICQRLNITSALVFIHDLRAGTCVRIDIRR